MLGWIQAALVIASAGIFLLLLFFFLRRSCRHRKPPQPPPIGTSPSLLNGIAKLHHHHQNNASGHKKRANYYVFRRGVPSKPSFNWFDNPSLITDAVENGWSRFGFADYASSASLRSNRLLLGSCAAAGRSAGGVEISWEVCQGSADFMQKIRLNSGFEKTGPLTAAAAASVVKSALPLPGPPLGSSSAFPQEAYFEITILSGDEGESEGDVKGTVGVNMEEGEKIKLIQENATCEKASDVNLRGLHVNIEELRGGSGDKDIVEGQSESAIMVSVGLTGEGSPPAKLPGTFPGSVGFNSDGSVYLDGVKLAFKSKPEEWGITDQVIGCGYNPNQKKVFFTLDSKLVHEICCKSEEFGAPLYPTLAANRDITVLVNFGQSVFRYAPANSQRTPNPCFIGPLKNSSTLGYEDSKELFSMGRIDSQWLNEPTTKGTQHNGSVNRAMSDYDEASEGDLFEIVLDKRSPNTLF